MKNYKLTHRLAAAMTMGAMAGSSTSAFAQANTDFVDLTNNIVTSTSGFQNMISLLGYLGGSGMAVAGIFKLKQHVDNPGNHPMKDGLMRLASGGALLSLPFMVNAMKGSVSNGNTDAATITKLDAFSTAGVAG